MNIVMTEKSNKDARINIRIRQSLKEDFIIAAQRLEQDMSGYIVMLMKEAVDEAKRNYPELYRYKKDKQDVKIPVDHSYTEPTRIAFHDADKMSQKEFDEAMQAAKEIEEEFKNQNK